MSEDERLAWARLVSGRAVESHRLWRRYYDDPSSLTDEERSDGVLQRGLVRALWSVTAYTALAAIGYLSDTFTAASPVDAVDALGMVMCHVGALAELSELTMSAVIGLALQRLIDGEVPLLPSSDLARSLSFRGDHEMSARLDALAGVVARAMDDVHINHGVEVKPMELYRRIAAEVIAGRMPSKPAHDPLELRYSLERQPEPEASPEPDRKAEAFARLRAAFDADERLLDVLATRRKAAQSIHGGDRAQISGLAIGPATDRQLAESVGMHVAEVTARLAQVERSSVLNSLFGRGAVPGLAEQRVCPQCAGLLSERGDGMLACPSQHEFTAQQLQALGRASTADEPTG